MGSQLAGRHDVLNHHAVRLQEVAHEPALAPPEKPFGAQALAGVAKDPTGNLLPIGLVMFAILGGLCAIPAVLVAHARERYFSA